MRRPIVTIVMLIFLIISAAAQEKQKEIRLSFPAVQARKLQLLNALNKRRDELLSNDPIFRDLLGQYNGLAMMEDSTLMVGDSTQVKKETKTQPTKVQTK